MTTEARVISATTTPKEIVPYIFFEIEQLTKQAYKITSIFLELSAQLIGETKPKQEAQPYGSKHTFTNYSEKDFPNLKQEICGVFAEACYFLNSTSPSSGYNYVMACAVKIEAGFKFDDNNVPRLQVSAVKEFKRSVYDQFSTYSMLKNIFGNLGKYDSSPDAGILIMASSEGKKDA